MGGRAARPLVRRGARGRGGVGWAAARGAAAARGEGWRSLFFRFFLGVRGTASRCSSCARGSGRRTPSAAAAVAAAAAAWRLAGCVASVASLARTRDGVRRRARGGVGARARARVRARAPYRILRENAQGKNAAIASGVQAAAHSGACGPSFATLASAELSDGRTARIDAALRRRSIAASSAGRVLPHCFASARCALSPSQCARRGALPHTPA